MNHRQSQRGITLIELLITAAALAVLVAVLTPALAGVRRQSKATVCLQNLGRIAQASITYAMLDPDEQAIPVHNVIADEASSPYTRIGVPLLAYGGKSGRGTWNDDPYYWGTPLGRGPATRPLNDIVYKGGFPNYAPPTYRGYSHGDALETWWRDEELELGLFRCPSDTGYTGLHYTDYHDSGLTSFDFFGNSYMANAFWVQDGVQIYAGAAMLRPLSQVPSPTSTILYMEHCARFATDVSPQPANGCGYSEYDRVIRGWHGEPWLFSLAFADGHADQVRMRGFESPWLGRYPEYSDANYGYLMYRCIVFRGPGWQLDALPAALVATGIPPYNRIAPADCGADRPPGMRPVLPLAGTIE